MSVFAPRDTYEPPPQSSIDIDMVKCSIPKNCYSVPNENYSKIKVESRWRFIKMNNINYVEISRKRPGVNREYLFHDMEWVFRNIGNEYDPFVDEQYYYYSDK